MSNKTSDNNVAKIEDDVKILENMIEEYENCSVPEIDMQVDITFRKRQADAIQNILAELEQKDKRIKELEKENEELLEVMFYKNF